MRKDKKIPFFMTSIFSLYITFESTELHYFKANPCGNAGLQSWEDCPLVPAPYFVFCKK